MNIRLRRYKKYANYEQFGGSRSHVNVTYFIYNDTKRTVPFVLYCALGMGEQKKPRSVTARLFLD